MTQPERRDIVLEKPGGRDASVLGSQSLSPRNLRHAFHAPHGFDDLLQVRQIFDLDERRSRNPPVSRFQLERTNVRPRLRHRLHASVRIPIRGGPTPRSQGESRTASPSLSCQSMSSSPLRLVREKKQIRTIAAMYAFTPRPRVTYPTTLSPAAPAGSIARISHHRDRRRPGCECPLIVPEPLHSAR